MSREVMCVELEATDEGGYRCASFGCRSAVAAPARLQGLGDAALLIGREGQVCFYSPGVSVLRVQRGGFVVTV